MEKGVLTHVRRYLIALAFVCFMLANFCVHHAYAAAPVVKITTSSKYYQADGETKEVESLHGRTSSGKKIWTYKSKKCTATELSPLSYTIHDGRVQVIEGKTLKLVNLQTGEVVKKVTLEESMWRCLLITVCADNDIFIAPVRGRYVYKFSSKGKMIWKKKIPKDCYFPYEIEHNGSSVRISYEEGGSFKIKDKCEVSKKYVCIRSMTDTKIKYYNLKHVNGYLKKSGDLKSMSISKPVCLRIPDEEYYPDTPCMRISRTKMKKYIKECKDYNGSGFYCVVYIKNGKCIKIEDVYWS